MRLILAVLLCGLVSLPAAAADRVQALALQQQVERLSETVPPVAAGRTIAATALIEALYDAREHRLAWVDGDTVAALLEAIESSVLDGLRPADFHADAVRAYRDGPPAASSDPLALATRDIVLTDALARLLHQLRHGKVDPRSLDPNWNFARREAQGDVVAQLNAALDHNGVSTLIDAARPAKPNYRALRQALAHYRAIAADGGWPALPPGPTLRPGMSDPAIPVLRARLAATGDLDQEATSDPVFDDTIEAALRRFQERHGLETDGLAGPLTRNALDVPVDRRIDQLRVNLERARWLGERDAADLIEVDIAGFSVERRAGETVEWQSRAIVGQPFRQTPVFADAIDYIVLNPTWTVPRSILVKDIIPRIRANPAYLHVQGFTVTDEQGLIVPLETATLAALEDVGFPRSWTLTQAPGPRNALGRIKFMFPNAFAVYLHDTPERTLFERNARSFSSGCIRVEDSLGLALNLLASKPGWDRTRIETAIASGRTIIVRLERPVPVHLLYRTAVAEPDGRLLFRDDIYGRDDPLLAALDAPFDPSILGSRPTTRLSWSGDER